MFIPSSVKPPLPLPCPFPCPSISPILNKTMAICHTHPSPLFLTIKPILQWKNPHFHPLTWRAFFPPQISVLQFPIFSSADSPFFSSLPVRFSFSYASFPEMPADLLLPISLSPVKILQSPSLLPVQLVSNYCGFVFISRLA